MIVKDSIDPGIEFPAEGPNGFNAAMCIKFFVIAFHKLGVKELIIELPDVEAADGSFIQVQEMAGGKQVKLTLIQHD